MTDGVDGLAVQQVPIHIASQSNKVHEDDACLYWLRQKYPSLPVDIKRSKNDVPDATGSKQSSQTPQLAALANDLRACDSLAWSRFSFPSEPHRPLQSNYNNETKNPHPLKATLTGEKALPSAPCDAVTVALVSDEKDGRAASSVLPFDAEPSRNIFREVVLKRDLERRLSRHPHLDGQWTKPEAPQDVLDGVNTLPRTATRPYFGGYVAPISHRDSFRFLLFPQYTHSLFSSKEGCVTAAGMTPEVRSKRANTPQEVPYYVRGSASLKIHDEVSRADARETCVAAPDELPLSSRVWDAVQLSLSASSKIPKMEDAPEQTTGSPRSWWWWPWRSLPCALAPAYPAAVEAELYTNASRTERRYDPERGKVERRRLLEDGVAITFRQPNPRYSSTARASFTTVEGSGARHLAKERKSGHETVTADANMTDDAILHFSLQDAFNSSEQLIRPGARSSGTYEVQWSAGPGIEFSTFDRHSTIFGKLSAESWIEWPVSLLGKKFKLRIRNQSSLMQPLEFLSISPDAFIGDEKEEQAAPRVNGSDGVRTVAEQRAVGTPSSRRWWGSGPHEYLWATQGPKWNPKLIRGFDNDYSSIHHSKNWYSVFSIELSRKKFKKSAPLHDELCTDNSELARDSAQDERRSTEVAGPATASSSGMLGNANIMGFANACFVDSFTQYPRASVGVSLTSEVPRVTVDAFNKIIPQKLECSFSWFVAFKERELQTGLQSPDLPGDMQYMRVSPVETFRHMKCGLTWKF